jgi:pimeloyl-ACP methyl ester carboxylesterase/DNA-binding CsgD family transcriptional regulator
MLDAWPSLAEFADRDPALLAALMQAAVGPESAGATGALVEGEAVAFGVVDARGRLVRAGVQFHAWVGDPAESVDCLELARKALAKGRASGRVRTLRQGVLATLAIADRRASPWAGLAPARGVRPDDRGVLLVVFAPSRSQALIGRAADALGLSPLQRRLALALLDESSLEAAALSLGIGRETARDALDSALQKAGVRRSSQLVGRLIDLSCNLTEITERQGVAAAAALGLSPSEAAVAGRVADGDTADEAALALGLRPATVKAYRRAIFDKLGISRSRDLRRLIAEAGELERLSGFGEVELQARPPAGNLGIVNDADGRAVAFMDYGPPRGRPLMLMHGFSTGRLAPPPLLRALAAVGRRVIVVQRPGFGLTGPATGDYLATAVADMALVLDRLNCRSAAVLGRDGGTAIALAFGTAWPERVEIGVLQNPRAPSNVVRRARSPLSAISAMLLRHPALLEPYARMMMRQTRRDVVLGRLRRVFAVDEADRACFEAHGVADFLVDDLMGLTGRATRGAIAEQRLHVEGWRLDSLYRGPRWRLAYSGHCYSAGDEDVWAEVSAGAPLILLEAGWLVQFTHAEALAALFRQ